MMPVQEFGRPGYEEKELGKEPSNANLLLAYLSSYRHFPETMVEPISIEQLAGTLFEYKSPVNTTLAMLRAEDGLDGLKKSIDSGKYRYVGLSMPWGSLEDGTEIMDHIAKRNASGEAEISVIAGGDLPTNLPVDYVLDMVNKYPFVTFVRGWGDLPLLEVMKYKSGQTESLKDIPGLIYKDLDGVHINPLSIAADEFLPGRPVRAFCTEDVVANITASINCSYACCTFCARKPYGGRERWIPRPIENVIGQMQDLSDIGIKQATFTDEETLGTEFVHALTHAYPMALAIQEAKKTGKVHPDFKFAFSTRSDTVNTIVDHGRTDILKALYEAGWRRIFLGVESGIGKDFQRWDNLDIPSQGRRYGKGTPPENHLRAVNICRDLGLDLEIGFILFDPLVDLGELKENAGFLLENGLVDYTSVVLQKLRIQHGSKYHLVMDRLLERLHKAGKLEDKPHLMKEFTPSILQTDYDFLHPLVSDIYSLVSELGAHQNRAVYTLKTYHRANITEVGEKDNVVVDTLTKLRESRLDLLIKLIDAAEMELKEREIPREQYDRLAGDFRDLKGVGDVIKDYNQGRMRIWQNLFQTGQGVLPGSLLQSLSEMIGPTS